ILKIERPANSEFRFPKTNLRCLVFRRKKRLNRRSQRKRRWRLEVISAGLLVREKSLRSLRCLLLIKESEQKIAKITKAWRIKFWFFKQTLRNKSSLPSLPSVEKNLNRRSQR